jgi:hypothetical protein
MALEELEKLGETVAAAVTALQRQSHVQKIGQVESSQEESVTDNVQLRHLEEENRRLRVLIGQAVDRLEKLKMRL